MQTGERMPLTLMLVAALSIFLTMPAQADGTWEYLENRDPHSNGLVAVARYADPSGAHAMVRCWSSSGFLDIRIGFPGVERQSLNMLHLSFDDAPPVPADYRRSPNRRTVIITPGERRQVLEGLRRALVVHIAAGFDNGTEEHVSLALTGSARAISQLESSCFNS